jgi:hypothetical protein
VLEGLEVQERIRANTPAISSGYFGLLVNYSEDRTQISLKRCRALLPRASPCHVPAFPLLPRTGPSAQDHIQGRCVLTGLQSHTEPKEEGHRELPPPIPAHSQPGLPSMQKWCPPAPLPALNLFFKGQPEVDNPCHPSPLHTHWKAQALPGKNIWPSSTLVAKVSPSLSKIHVWK